MVRSTRWLTRDSRGVPLTLSRMAPKSLVEGLPFRSSRQGMPRRSSSSASSSTRSGWGRSWTRYRKGISAFNAARAEAMLAAIIICSMSRSASPVVRGSSWTHTPFSSRTNFVSSLERSMLPRASAAFWNTWNNS